MTVEQATGDSPEQTASSATRLAFVSAPGGSRFMTEILQAVADAVQGQGVETLMHTGYAHEVDDGRTAIIIVPHEYFVLAQAPRRDVLARTISFGVEHPGTNTFEASAAAAAQVRARFEISPDAAQEMARRGQSCEPFSLGYVPRWDQWHLRDIERPVDTLFLGTADPGRLQTLARLAPELSDLDARLLIPPHEQMTAERRDFLTGEHKWALLASSKSILNIHRGSKTALEWVRCLEAMCNGCVIITEPSIDMGPLLPGEHLLVARREQLGSVLRAGLADPVRLRSIAVSAYRFCQNTLDMHASAARLIAVAQGVVAADPKPATKITPESDDVTTEGALISEDRLWAPEAYQVPADWDPSGPQAIRSARQLAALRRLHANMNTLRAAPTSVASVDVICVDHAGSGPLGPTAVSVATQSIQARLHVAGIGRSEVPQLSGIASYIACSPETSIGAARNALIEASTARFLFVLDSGDQLLRNGLARVQSALALSASTVVSYMIAAHGSDTLVNLFYPDRWRLKQFGYLTRGYLVRRSWLDELEGFAEDPALDALVDYDFWMRTCRRVDRVVHIPQIGLQLWPTDSTRLALVDPVEASELLERRMRPAA
jgi:hypothetical protein